MLCLFVSAVSCFCGIAAAANGADRVDLKVVFRVDESHVATPFYLNLAVEWYDGDRQPDQWTDADANETAFRDFLAAVDRKDGEYLVRHISSAVSEEQRAPLASAAIQQLALMSDVSVCCQLFDGTDRIFVCKADADRLMPGRLEYYFGIGFRMEESRPVWNGFDDSVLSGVVLDSFNYSTVTPESCEITHTVYSLMPSGSNEGQGWTPPGFKFNGVVCDYTLCEDVPDANTSDIVRSYDRIQKSLLSDSPSVAATNFTAYSRQKYIRWAEGPSAESFEVNQSRLVGAIKRIIFVLNAEPIYVVFYTDQLNGIGSVRYDMLRKEPSGSVKLANFQVFGAVDDLLSDRGRFVKDWILPIVYEEWDEPVE